MDISWGSNRRTTLLVGHVGTGKGKVTTAKVFCTGVDYRGSRAGGWARGVVDGDSNSGGGGGGSDGDVGDEIRAVGAEIGGESRIRTTSTG